MRCLYKWSLIIITISLISCNTADQSQYELDIEIINSEVRTSQDSISTPMSTSIEKKVKEEVSKEIESAEQKEAERRQKSNYGGDCEKMLKDLEEVYNQMSQKDSDKYWDKLEEIEQDPNTKDCRKTDKKFMATYDNLITKINQL